MVLAMIKGGAEFGGRNEGVLAIDALDVRWLYTLPE